MSKFRPLEDGEKLTMTLRMKARNPSIEISDMEIEEVFLPPFTCCYISFFLSQKAIPNFARYDDDITCLNSVQAKYMGVWLTKEAARRDFDARSDQVFEVFPEEDLNTCEYLEYLESRSGIFPERQDRQQQFQDMARFFQYCGGFDVIENNWYEELEGAEFNSEEG